MYQDFSILIQFDLLLARSGKQIFDTQDIDELLNKISSKYLDKKYCLNWFLENDILINNGLDYYYTGEKVERYKPYRGHQKIVKIFRDKDGLPIEFDFINFKIE
jgi:hypothetical protein